MPDGNNIWELIKQNGDLVNREHWAPIGGVENGWIQVGAPEGESCRRHQQLSDKDPPWKMSGADSFEVTGYVMCCLEPKANIEMTASTVEAAPIPPSRSPTNTSTMYHEHIWYNRSKGWSGQTYQDAVDFCMTKVNSRGGGMTLCEDHAYDEKHVLCCSRSGVTAVVAPEKQTPAISSVPFPSADKTTYQDLVDTEFKAVYEMMNDRIEHNLKPVLYNRTSGWTGNTHSEALEFCRSRLSDSTDLCPFSSLCPNGTTEDQSIDTFSNGPVWAPMAGAGRTDVLDLWVEMHYVGQCKVQSNLDKDHDVTRYVMCCKPESEVVNGVDGSVPFDAELAVTSPPRQLPNIDDVDALFTSFDAELAVTPPPQQPPNNDDVDALFTSSDAELAATSPPQQPPNAGDVDALFTSSDVELGVTFVDNTK